MNAIYRSVYNESLGAWVAVPEFVSAKGKKSNSVVKAEQPSSTQFTGKRSLGNRLLSSVLIPVLGGVTLFMMQGTVLADCTFSLQNQGNGTVAVSVGSGSTASSCLQDLSALVNTTGLGGVHFVSINGKDTQGNYTNNGATGVNAIAIGSNAKSSGTNAVALGVSAKATAGHATALGGFSEAASSATAVGYTANASASGAAIGVQAESGEFAAALGFDAEAKGRQSVSIGHLSRSHSANSVAVGALANTAGSAVAVGYGAKGTGGFSVALGKGATASKTSAIAIGASNDTVTSSAQATGVSSISIGKGSLASSTNAIAIGSTSQATGVDSIAIGKRSQATGIDAVAVGRESVASGEKSISIGTGNTVLAARSGAIGDPTTIIAEATDSYSIGNNNTVNTADTFVMGNNVKTTVANSVYLGKNAAASATVTPATAGTTTYSSSTINGVSYNYAGGTPTGVVSVGDVGKERRIQNVAAGLISATSTDAINGSQLYAVATSVGNISNQVGNTYFHTNTGTNTGTGNATTNLGAITDAAGATGLNAITAGMNATAKGSTGLAVGHTASSRGSSSVAVGTNTLAGSSGSIAIGSAAQASRGTNYSILAWVNSQSVLMEYGLNFATEADLKTYVDAVQVKKDKNQRVTAAEEFVYRSAVDHMNNLAIGQGAIATGGRTISIGENAGGISAINKDGSQDRTGPNFNNFGIHNVNIGTNAGTNNQNVDKSVAIGYQAGYLDQSTDAGKAAITAQNAVKWNARSPNTYLGNQAGYNASGFGSIGIGQLAGNNNSGAGNIAIGSSAGTSVGKLVGTVAVSTPPSSGWTGWGPLYCAYGVDPACTYGTLDGTHNTALGNNAGRNVNGSLNVGIGYRGGDDAKGYGNVGIGSYAGGGAIGSHNVAVGTDAGAYGVVGNANAAFGAGAGRGVKGDNNVAMGHSAGENITGSSNIAIGESAGKGSTSSTPETIAEAISIGRNSLANANQAIAIGTGAKASGVNAISIGTGNVVIGDKSAAIGDPNYVSGIGSMVYGNSNVVNSAGTYVFGSNVNNKTPGAIAADTDPAADALKYGTTAANSVYLGDYSTASTVSGIGTKNLSREYADGSTTTGGLTGTVSEGKIGYTTVNGVEEGGITYGNFAGATSVGAITVGAAGEERRIQNVAAGEISATSTDAINGSQLYATNNVVFNVANSTKNILGGNAALNPNGTITMTNIGGTTKNTIHEAIQYAAQGWNLIVDTGTATPVAPGGTVTLKSIDDRIILGQNKSEVTFKLADNVATSDDGMKFAGDDGVDPTKIVSRKLNEQLNILGGADATKLSDNNIGVIYGDDSSLQVKLAKDLVGLNSTTFTDGTNTTVVNASGLTINGGPSITIGGINAGGKQITHVASGGSINVDADKFNAANMGDLSNAINNITNAGTGGGFGLKDEAGAQFMQNLGTAAQIVGDGNIKTAVVDTAGGGKALKVSLADEIKIGSDPTNQTIINQGSVTTNNLTVKGETKLGDNFNVTNAGDVHYTGPITEGTHIVNKQYVDKIIDGSAGGGFGLSDDNGNKFMQNLGTAAQIIGDGSIATSVVDTATGKALQVSLSDNVNIGKAGADGKDGTLGVHGKDGSSVVINGKDGSIGATGADGKHGVSINGKDGSIGLTGPAGTTTIRTELGAPGVDGTDGITRIQYTDPSGNNHQVATLDDGLKYTGNVGSISAKLGETVNVLGGAARADTTYSTTNVTTVASGKTIEVRMADSPKFAGEVQADGGVSVSDHLTVNPGTTVNMGGNQITNVAPGTEDNHAATVGQVKGLAQNINNAYGDLSNTIEKNRREANAGTAAAMAIAGLGQPYKPGQSMVSLGTGVWRGQTGYALGVSGITDNGKWLLKGAVSGSGRGGVGGSASINYVW